MKLRLGRGKSWGLCVGFIVESVWVAIKIGAYRLGSGFGHPVYIKDLRFTWKQVNGTIRLHLETRLILNSNSVLLSLIK